MENLNQTFWEEYIQVDKLCKDMLCSDKGISTYIEIMDDTPIEYRRYADNYDDVYKHLKHLRWKRNQLAHEKENFNEPFATQEDIDYIVWFKGQIMAITDPLAVIKAQVRKLEQDRNQLKKRWQANADSQYLANRQREQEIEKKQQEQSFFSKLKNKIKNMFK